MPHKPKSGPDKRQRRTKDDNLRKVLGAIYQCGNNIDPIELTKITGLHRVSVYRYLRGFVKAGFLEHHGGIYTIIPHKPIHQGVLEDLIKLKGRWRMLGMPDMDGLSSIQGPDFALDDATENSIRKILIKNVKLESLKKDQTLITFIITKNAKSVVHEMKFATSKNLTQDKTQGISSSPH